MVDSPETRYAKTPDGLSLAYQALGEGPPDILFYPPSGCIEVIWDEPSYAGALHRLADIGRLILYDGRGIGASDPLPGATPTPVSWIEDMPVVLDEVGSSSCSVIALGASGFIGILFAALHPGRTDSLVLVDTYARGRQGEGYPYGPTPEASDAVFQAIEAGWGRGVMARVFAPTRAADDSFRRWHARYERATVSPGTLRRILEWSRDFDVRAYLSTIHVPTLVLHAAQSYLPLEVGRYLADNIDGAAFRAFPGADVFPFNSESAEVVGEIEEFITGRPSASRPERALATVLFTDIVRSTEQAASLGDKRWADLLDRHDQLIQRELERYRGRKVNPTGDGVLATFDSPSRAVRCAQAICRSMPSLGLEVRAGVHTGEVELRGEDVAGIAVHIGQRVSALASPGEVVTSSTVADLVVGSDLQFDPRGEHHLKGIEGTWRIFVARAD